MPRCKSRPHTTLQVIHQVPYRCLELLPAVEVQSFLRWQRHWTRRLLVIRTEGYSRMIHIIEPTSRRALGDCGGEVQGESPHHIVSDAPDDL